MAVCCFAGFIFRKNSCWCLVAWNIPHWGLFRVWRAYLGQTKARASRFRLITVAVSQAWICMFHKPRRMARRRPCRALASPCTPSTRPRWRLRAAISGHRARPWRRRARRSAPWPSLIITAVVSRMLRTFHFQAVAGLASVSICFSRSMFI